MGSGNGSGWGGFVLVFVAVRVLAGVRLACGGARQGCEDFFFSTKRKNNEMFWGTAGAVEGAPCCKSAEACFEVG